MTDFLDDALQRLLGLTRDDLRLLTDRSVVSVASLLARRAGAACALAALDAARGADEGLTLADERVRLLLEDGRYDEAAAAARVRLARQHSLSVQSYLARALLNLGDLQGAADVAAAMLAVASDRVTSLYIAGLVALARRQDDLARGHFERLVELHEESPAGPRGLARLALVAGDPARAFDLTMGTLDEATIAPADLLRELALYAGRLPDPIHADDARRRIVAAAAARDAALDARDETLRSVLATEIGKARAAGDRTAHKRASPPAPSHTSHEDEGDDDVLLDEDAVVLPPAPPPDPAAHAGLVALLRDAFGYEDFRAGQEETIAAVLAGRDTLAVMPTGAGKSLCYQLPALTTDGASPASDDTGSAGVSPVPALPETTGTGETPALPGDPQTERVTLVISPLIALMKDQVDSLPPALLARTTLINSVLETAEMELRLGEIAAGRYRLVYAAPERLRQRPFVHALARAGVRLVVIDEAHCLSMWGHDFRPDYLFIRSVLPDLGDPQVLAMTATATPAMMGEIAAALGRELCLVNTGVLRDNLYLITHGVENDDHKMRVLVPFVQHQRGSGIVYVSSRDNAERLEKVLRQAGVNARAYHAGLGTPERSMLQDRFMDGEVRVMIATVAFGMGVDKSDVRFIVHYNPPRSLEAYSQESGRAGRDGKPAVCLLLHARADRTNLKRWSREQAVDIAGLRAVYRQVRVVLKEGRGLVDAPALRERLELEGQRDVDLRVAMSILENSGLLRRGPDIPRGATVVLTGDDASRESKVESRESLVRNQGALFDVAPPGTAGILPAAVGRQDAGGPRGYASLQSNPSEKTLVATDGLSNEADEATPDGVWDAFLRAARLDGAEPGRRARSAPLDLVAIAGELGLGPVALEDQLLAWQDEKRLTYHGVGRDMLIELLPPPSDTAAHMSRILDGLAARNQRRLRALFAYLDTRECRHRFIARHFGHDAPEVCRRCDVCRPVTLTEAEPAVNATRLDDPTEGVRRLVGQFPLDYGKTGVIEVLKGVMARRLHAARTPLFGALAHASRASIERAVDQLLAEGEVVVEMKGEYAMLRLKEVGSRKSEVGSGSGRDVGR